MYPATNRDLETRTVYSQRAALRPHTSVWGAVAFCWSPRLGKEEWRHLERQCSADVLVTHILPLILSFLYLLAVLLQLLVAGLPGDAGLHLDVAR